MENKRYLIDGEEVTKEEFEERLEKEVDEYVRDNYDDLLDECYGPYEIGYCTLYASEILKNCDPIAYSCAMHDYIDSELGEATWEVEEYGFYEVNGYKFKIEEIEEEEKEE